jgi:hypothetical protein
VGDIARGTTHIQGNCVGTDPAGDYIVIDLSGEWPANATTFRITNKLTSGTGKYAGISGIGTFVNHGPEFRTAAEGTHRQHRCYTGQLQAPLAVQRKRERHGPLGIEPRGGLGRDAQSFGRHLPT